MTAMIGYHGMPTGCRQPVQPIGEILLCTGEPVKQKEGPLTDSGLGYRQFDITQVDGPLVHTVHVDTQDRRTNES